MQQQILIRIKPLVTGVTCNIPDEMFKDLCISSNFTSQNCPTIPPWCIASTCLCRLNRFPNLILQTGHFYVLRPACTRLTCLFRLSFISNDLVHSERCMSFLLEYTIKVAAVFLGQQGAPPLNHDIVISLIAA